jgi:hypothetical protein
MTLSPQAHGRSKPGRAPDLSLLAKTLLISPTLDSLILDTASLAHQG